MLSILISGGGGRPTQPNTNFKIIWKLDSENMAKIEMETTTGSKRKRTQGVAVCACGKKRQISGKWNMMLAKLLLMNVHVANRS